MGLSLTSTPKHVCIKFAQGMNRTITGWILKRSRDKRAGEIALFPDYKVVKTGAKLTNQTLVASGTYAGYYQVPFSDFGTNLPPSGGVDQLDLHRKKQGEPCEYLIEGSDQDYVCTFDQGFGASTPTLAEPTAAGSYIYFSEEIADTTVVELNYKA